MIRNVIVVGGGIAGLACAAVLGRTGASVTVLERAHDLSEVGAGLQVSPNGLAVLRAMGLETALQQRGAVQAQAVSLRDYQQSGEVARLDLTRLGVDQRYYFVHRADVLAVLLDAARRAGVEIVTNAQVTALSQGDPAQVRTADGTVRRAELVVCADGFTPLVAKPSIHHQSHFSQGKWRGVLWFRTPASRLRHASTWGRGGIL